MKANRHKLATMVVAAFMVLTAFFVMATPISRNEVTACAGSNQVVDVGETVQFDGTCSQGVGTLSYKWFLGDGNVAFGPQPTHTYEGTTPGPTPDEEGTYYVTLVVKDSNNVYDLDTVRIIVINHHPIADAGSSMIVDEDEIVLFDNSGSSDLNNDIVSTNWNFGDGNELNADLNTVVQHTYDKAGVYPVTLTVTDNDGAFDEDVIFVTVNNVEPYADGLANGELDDDLMIYIDDPVTFDASGSLDTPSDMSSLEYSWVFGDGSKANGISTTRTYTRPGAFITYLTVTDDNGASDYDPIVVRVLESNPIADASSDQTANEGDTVFFDATGSSDTPSDQPVLNYSWSFGDHGTLPTHNWYDDSINNVDLLVKDDEGYQGTDSMTVTVENVPPVASIDDVYVPVDFKLRISGEKWHDVIVTISESNIETEIIEIVRMPGSPNDQSKIAEDVHISIAESVDAKVYYTPMDDPINGSPNGATPVWLTMTFEDGTSYTLFRSFNVQKPEDWTWIHDMNKHTAGHPIHFEGSVYDPGSDDIQVIWDFGDGTAPIVNNHVSNGNHPMMISEHYIREFPFGIYTVNLMATDDDGGVDTMSLTITNTDILTCTNVAPRASSSGGKTVVEDEGFTLVGVGEDTGSDQNILTYKWDMKDGTIYNTPGVTHVYAKSGTYYPTLVVEDDEGAIGITSELVEVLNVVPTAVATADSVNVNEDDAINFGASSSTDTPTDLSILQYGWDFGDGSMGYGIGTTHVYSKKGTYQATLTTTDDNGAVGTSVLTIEVMNVVPYDLEITAEDTVNEDNLILFEAAIKDTPSDVPLLTYAWDFDDGTTGSGTNPTHAYSSHGHYTVKLTVTDDDAASSDILFYITVDNPAPVAYGGLSKNLYGPQMQVLFHGEGFDTHTDQSTLTYLWEFGDGASSTSTWTSHLYPTEGSETYTATFTVTDMHGASDVFHVTVNVKVDSDGDQLLDEEESALGTDPFDYDTDDDWLIDYYEVNPASGKPSTDPTKADMDGDGCTDWEEIWPGRDGYVTDPENPDMDDDGLEDCEESFANTFKSTERFMIGDYSTASGDVDVSLAAVRSSSPASHIITAEAKVGITHTSIGELKITLDNGARSVVLRDRVGGSADNLFISYDLFTEGFPATDFTSLRTWTLNVDDQVSSSERGFVEYFEIFIMSALNPMNSDTDNDGVSDSEEASLGDDGWLTDPWRPDTDGDGISDYIEPNGWKLSITKAIQEAWNGFKTDPTRADTDRDGVNDNDDWDPLNNLMVEVDLRYFIAYDDDTDTTQDDTEVFIGISVGPFTFDEKKTLWTDNQTAEQNIAKNLDRQYTFEVDDSIRLPHVIISAYDEDLISDDLLDIRFGPADRFSAGYDIIQGTPNDPSDDRRCYSYSGDGDGHNTDEDARLEWCISTVRPQRIRTILLNSTDSDSLHVAKDGKLRYVGEQEFYLVLLNATSQSSNFRRGYNAIIVPRTVFVNSGLNSSLESGNPPSYISDLEYSANDDEQTWTSGSIVGILQGKVSGATANEILWHLKHNESDDLIARSKPVTNQLVTLNLDDYLLKLIPFKGIEFDETGKDPGGFWEKAAEAFVSFIEVIGDFLIEKFNFLVRLTEQVIAIGMDMLQIVLDYISWVIDTVIFIAKALLDFTVAVVDWVIDLVVNDLLPILRNTVIGILGAIGGPVFVYLGEMTIGRAFNFFGNVLTWIAEDFIPGVVDFIKGMLDAGAALVDVIGGLALCLGDLSLAAFSQSLEGACSEIVYAIAELGHAMMEIWEAAVRVGGSALATVITIVLDWCASLSGARHLNKSEKQNATKIFGSSITLSNVLIADRSICTEFVAWAQVKLNIGNRPFTVGYVITVTDTTEWNNTVLIHELTHVWQYEQEGMDYVMDSIMEQNIKGKGEEAYNYGYDNKYDGSGGEDELNDAGGDFGQFNVEQQAKIIEHYYRRRYIDNPPSDYCAWQPYADIVHEP